MKIDPKFFESGAVTAISGEFGPMGELAVIKLLCAIRDSGYYRHHPPQELCQTPADPQADAATRAVCELCPRRSLEYIPSEFQPM